MGQRRAAATLAVGLLVLLAGLAATLAHASVRRTGTNDVTVKGVVDHVSGGRRICQDERMPAETAAVSLSVARTGGSAPPLAVELIDAAQRTPFAGGSARGWSDGAAIAPLASPVAHERAVLLCVRLAAPHGGGSALLLGAPAERATSATRDGEPLGGRFRIDYLEDGARSWWSYAPMVAGRMARAGVWAGALVPLIAGLLVSLSIGLAAWLLARTS